MSRGLGKVERAVLTALPDDGSPRTIYQLALAVYGRSGYERGMVEQWDHGAWSDRQRLPVVDQDRKVSVRRAVQRLERAGLVVTVPWPKIKTVWVKGLPEMPIMPDNLAGRIYGSEVVHCPGIVIAKVR